MFKASLLLVCVSCFSIGFSYADTSIPPQIFKQETSPFPLKQDIIINVLIKGPKGCLQQGRFEFPGLSFFLDNLQLTQKFELKDSDKKVIGHFRTDVEVTQISKDRSRFKIAMITFDTDAKPEKLVDVAIAFMSSGNFFAYATRFEAPDPKLGFAEILIGDDLFFESGKKKISV
jgi:hypothetical protein